MQNPDQPQSTLNLQQGNGVLASSTTRSFSQGEPIQTDVPTDFCIQGDGFFTVLNPAGGVQYTRNGYFTVSKENDGQYLVTAQGYYVLDANSKKIKLPDNMEGLTVGKGGELSIGTGTPFATLNIASFTNNDGLQSVGDNCYTATDASGTPARAQGFEVRQGCLEGSNVDLALETSRLIRAQRTFSLVGKIITTTDEMEAMANNIRK
jgi:flagellar basal-body rod protein FlgG